MSSGNPETRARILDAALALLEERPDVPPSMGAIAERAGVSRQALYLHFADRGSLLVELSREIDARLRAPRQRRIDEAATARDALREAVKLQAWLKPQLRGFANAMLAQRLADPGADEAYREREQARLERCRQVIDRLARDGELHDGWRAEAAAQVMWAVTSQRVWEDLVVDQGLSTRAYVESVTALLEAGLCSEAKRAR